MSRAVRRASVLGLVAVVVSVSLVAAVSPSTGSASTDRVAGADRYQTAVEVAVLVGGGSLAGLDRLIIVSGESFPDGLAASGLAGFLDDGGRSGRTAILLTQSGVLPPVVADAIRASGVPADRILIVGGVGAVSDAVRSQIASVAGWDGAGVVPVTRIAGEDRYETAAAIVDYVLETAGDELPASYSTVLVASGEQFPDALAAGSLAYRNGHLLLLSPQPAAPTVTLEAVGDLTANCAVLIGGTAALAPPVATQLDTTVTGTGCGVERIAGQNRYDTAAQVANRFVAVNGAPREPLLASGVNFADALTTGPLAAGNRPLLLTTPDQLPAATSTWLRQQRASINEVLIIGGTNTINPTVGNEVNQDLTPPRPTPPPTTPGPAGLNLSYASTSFSTSQTSQTRAPTVTGESGTLSFASTGTLPTGVTFNTTTGVFTGPAAWNFEATQVSAGGAHTCALTTSGGVKCWGRNTEGQLGDNTPTDSSTPVDVIGLMSGVASISAGGAHTCALTTSGSVKCWGWNTEGQLGDGTTTQRTTPVDVLATGASPGGTLLSGVASISAGSAHTCAVTTSGSVKCWGWNLYDQLGDNTPTDSSTPVDVIGLMSGVASVSAGYGHTCAVTTSGGAKCWGWNFYGQLGDGNLKDSSTPVDVIGLMSGVASVSAGEAHTCAVTTSGSVKCWGWNAYGQLGDNTPTDSSTPVDVIGLMSGVASVSAGSAHTCAVTTSGSVKCWGWNLYGQLGDNTPTDSSTPVDVIGLMSGVASVSAGYGHTCAVTTSGGAKCWGWNLYGQLGDDTKINRTTPVDVTSSGVDPGWPASITVTATDSAGSATVTVTLTKTSP